MLATLSCKTTRVNSSLRLSAKMWASLLKFLPTRAVYPLVEQRITLFKNILFSQIDTTNIIGFGNFQEEYYSSHICQILQPICPSSLLVPSNLEFLVPGYGKAVKSMFQRWECQSLPFEIGRPPSLLVTICNGIQLKLARKHFAWILFSPPNPIEVLYRLGNWSDQAVSR